MAGLSAVAAAEAEWCLRLELPEEAAALRVDMAGLAAKTVSFLRTAL